MRKIVFLLLITILLQSCGVAPVTNTPQPTSTIFVTYTLIDTPTSTFTPVPSASPTIVKIPTQDPNLPFPTFPPIPIFIGDVTATPVIITTATISKPGPGFVSVDYSPTNIYWGGCEGNQAVIKAEVEDPENVNGVIIFMRVKDFFEEDYTPWTSGNIMYNNQDGTFTYIAIGSEIEGHNNYKKSAIYFQLVAVDDEGKEVGRTRIYEGVITMSPCPCLTPITGCPVPTKKP
jgi:hypothetical protein